MVSFRVRFSLELLQGARFYGEQSHHRPHGKNWFSAEQIAAAPNSVGAASLYLRGKCDYPFNEVCEVNIFSNL
jgi:hypothetical protein